MAKKKKSNSGLILALGHALTLVTIILVFSFGALGYLSASTTLLGTTIVSETSFYEMLKITDETVYAGGVTIIVLLSITALLTLLTIASTFTKGKSSTLFGLILCGLMVASAILIFTGYEMYFAQIEDLGVVGAGISLLGRETTDPGVGYYLMGISASVGAAIEAAIILLKGKLD